MGVFVVQRQRWFVSKNGKQSDRGLNERGGMYIGDIACLPTCQSRLQQKLPSVCVLLRGDSNMHEHIWSEHAHRRRAGVSPGILSRPGGDGPCCLSLIRSTIDCCVFRPFKICQITILLSVKCHSRLPSGESGPNAAGASRLAPKGDRGSVLGAFLYYNI